MPTSLWWIRRDLRTADNPALGAAVAAARSGARSGDDAAGGVLPLFVQDPVFWRPSGPRRQAYLAASLRALADAGVPVHVRRGDPVEQVVRAARAVGAEQVHVSADFMPRGRRRDEEVAAALDSHGISLVRTGSPYAVSPGEIRKPDGSPLQVYTPFYRRWTARGVHRPAPGLRSIPWLTADGATELAGVPAVDGLPDAGEQVALKRWRTFLDDAVADYDGERERPDHPGTSRLSVHLKYGEIHPRTILDDLRGATAAGAETFRKEIAWRDFYADVLFHRPETVHEYYKPELAHMRYDTGKQAEERFTAWTRGRTGFPLVDAGMRQLATEGWMHNRLRMVVGSFLVKDLHLEWTQGARWFMQQLVDGEVSSNQHGWQWIAGCGTDAAPYFRIFNPVTQGERYDPAGDYVRRYVAELRHIPGKAVHEPWRVADGYAQGYPEPIVDHKRERDEALARFAEVRGR